MNIENYYIIMALAYTAIYNRLQDLNLILDQIWIIICAIMVLLSQAGYMMRETGTIKMKNNSTILLNTILVISVSSLVYFFIGFGLSNNA